MPIKFSLCKKNLQLKEEHVTSIIRQEQIFKIIIKIIISIINNPKMFFGKVITQANSFIYNKQNVDETVGDVICISNAALVPTSKERTTLVLKKDGVEYKIAELTQQQPNASLNIFMEIDENIELLVKGNGVIHVVGFFQAQHKIDHLDQVELHHLHQHQAQKKQAHQQRQKQRLDKNQNRQKQINSQISIIEPEKQKNVKTLQISNYQQQQHSEQGAQKDQSLLSQQEQLESLSDLSQDGSVLKGLEDIDDDIGEQNKQSKKKSNQTQNKKQKIKNKNNGIKKNHSQIKNYENNEKNQNKNFENKKKDKKKEQKKREQAKLLKKKE